MSLIKYLQTPAKTFSEKIANVALAFGIVTVSTIAVITFYNWLFATENFLGFQIDFEYYKHPFLIEVFTTVILAPIGEEIVFRHFPLQVAKSLDRPKLILPIILITSVIFGWCHNGATSLPIQGVAGFVMACLYIKNGYSLWSSMLLHALWNASLIFGILHI